MATNLRCRLGGVTSGHRFRHGRNTSPRQRWRRHPHRHKQKLSSTLSNTKTPPTILHIGKSRSISASLTPTPLPTSTLASFTAYAGTNDAPTISLSSSRNILTAAQPRYRRLRLPADAETPDAYNSVKSPSPAEILDGSSEKLVINSALCGTIDQLTMATLPRQLAQLRHRFRHGRRKHSHLRQRWRRHPHRRTSRSSPQRSRIQNTSDNPSTSGNRVFDLGVTDSNSSPATSTLASFTASVAGTMTLPPSP